MAPGPRVVPLRTVMTSRRRSSLASTHAPEASGIRRTAKLPKSREPADDVCAVATRARTASSRDCSSSSLTSAESPPIQSERCGAGCCGSDAKLVPVLRWSASSAVVDITCTRVKRTDSLHPSSLKKALMRGGASRRAAGFQKHRRANARPSALRPPCTPWAAVDVRAGACAGGAWR
jgi:hypothetical protein